MGSFGQLGTGELILKQAIPKRISLKTIENMKTEANVDKMNLALHPNNIKKLVGSIKMVLSFDASFILISKKLFLFLFKNFLI